MVMQKAAVVRLIGFMAGATSLLETIMSGQGLRLRAGLTMRVPAMALATGQLLVRAGPG